MYSNILEAEIQELENGILERTKALRNAISVVDQRENTLVEQEKVQMALLHKLKDQISSAKISSASKVVAKPEEKKEENGNNIDIAAVKQKEEELKELDRKIRREKKAARAEEKRIEAEIAAMQDSR